MDEVDYLDYEDKKFKRISSKTKLNKEKYCKKNKLSNNRYGPHVYDSNGKYCLKCNHYKKEKKDYEY